MTRILPWIAAALFCLAPVAPASAQIDNLPKVHARLIAEHGTVAPGGMVTVALEQVIRDGWHTYWRNPGDAGQATDVQWTLPAGWHAGAIAWPAPKPLPVGPLMDYGYEGRPWLLMPITAPGDAKPGESVTLRAAVTWLVCKEVCIPEDATLTLPLAISSAPPPPDPAIAAQFAAARDLLPTQTPWPAHFQQSGPALKLFLAAPALSQADVKDAHFFPYDEGTISGIAPQHWSVTDKGLVMQLASGKTNAGLHALSGVIVLTSASAPQQAMAIAAAPGAVPDLPASSSEAELTLPLAMLFALLGGIILNLMPCVLPILAMKALTFASSSGREQRHVLQETAAYGVGAVLAFVALGGVVVALRQGGAAIGWGFQLQEPIVVAAFTLLIFAIGLNLSGVFEVPTIGAGESLTQRGGAWGAFFTGVLAVMVAAPCTAPFMAAALAFALSQTAPAALLVFFALGIGFAAPFVAIGASSTLRRLLPKPGGWMLILKQVLAFPMYGTALWLAWVLGLQTGASQLVLLLVCGLALAFALWTIGAVQRANGRSIYAWIAVILAAVALEQILPQLNAAAPASAHGQIVSLPSQPYSDTALASLRAQHRAVFVDATAAWCVTCLVNEKVALENADVRRAFDSNHVALLIADWTRRDPAVTALLTAHQRTGVPLYLYFAPDASGAMVLPQILTPADVVKALQAR
jgi:thiol:disulfide interchange protein DsbD